MECDRSYDAISRLRDCLLQLETGKINEKKDQIVKLQELLRSRSILEFLDANTANKKKEYRDWCDGMTWGKLFRRVVLYVNSEADRIHEREEAVESPSRAQVDNRTKEKQACSTFLKHVVKVIVSREQHTVYQAIWLHIAEVMTDSYKMAAFGPDYTNVLLKNILLNPQICLRISIPNYEKMIKRYARLSENPPGGWDRGLLVQVFYHLLLATYNQCDTPPQPLFNFFTNMFGSMKGEKASKYHEYLLRALILVCRNCALSCQVQLCNLGESILSPLMQLWKKSTDAIKELILEFILLQFTLHHPQGCVDSQLDGSAENSSIWRSSLTNLYHLVIKELNDICERTKYSSSKDLTLHPYFIAVAVEVCGQVFQDTCSTIEVTQIPSTYESSQACKKRRVDVSFKVFLDAILSFSSFGLIPWCQLMTAFLRKYPKIISLGDIASIINCLLEKHHACKQIEVKTSLLTSCCAAVEAFCVVQKSGASENVRSVNCDWWRLWELAVKCVSLMHQCHEEGHKLLSTLLLNKLITPKAEFLSLYCAGSNNKPSRASVTTLTIYMHHFPLPSVINTVQNASLAGKDSFRYQLLNWLFATDDNDDTDSFVSYLCSPNIDVPTANLTSSLLASICLQDYKPLLSTCLPFLSVSNNVSDPIEWISHLRQDLLHTTFNLPFIDYNKVSSTDNCAPVFSCSNLLMPVWQKMDELLQNVCAKIFDTSVVSKATLDGHAVHVKLGCIVLLLIKQLVLVDALGKSELVSLPLTIQIKNLLNVSMEQIHCRDLCLQQTWSTKGDSRIETLTFLATVVDISIQGNESSSRLCAMAIAEWLALLMPTDLGTILFKAINTNIHEKQTTSASNSMSKKQAKRRNRYQSQADVDNDEFLCPSTSTRGLENCSIDDDLDLRDDDNDLMNSTFNGGSNGDNQQSSSTLEFQLHCVEAIDSLLKLNIFIQPSGFEVSTYVERFLSIIDATIQPTQKSENVTLILRILKSLLKLPNLNIKAVENVLNVIKSLLNKHSKNRVVCLKIIHLFESTYPHIFRSVHSSPVKSVKTHLLHLLGVLWKKEQNEQLAVDVSIALANALCQLIKVDDKIQWINEPDKSVLGEGEHMKKSLLALFQCQRLEMRLVMASHLGIFFSDPNNTSISTEEQVKMLEKNCKESVTYLKDFESENMQAQHLVQDEKLNFSTSLLYLLCNGYIFGDNFCRKHVLFIIFKLVKDNIISEKLTMKALLQIEHILKYKKLRDLVDHGIMYIFHQWIEMKYSIKDFPWRLLELTSQQQFFQMYYEKLVPIYVYHSDIQSIKYLASVVDLNIEEVIVMCFPSMLARVLSWRAINPKCLSAKRCMAFLEEHVAKESLTTTLESSVGEIFVALLYYVKESHDSIEMPQANCHCLSYMSPQDFSRSIELYQKGTSMRSSFVQFLCSKQDSLQNILLSVHTSLWKSHVLDEQVHALLMYSVLLNQLEPHFTSCLRKFIPFIVTEFVYSLINFIIKNGQTSDSGVLERNIKLIYNMCECVLPVSEADIGKVLPFIVSRLVPFVSESSFGKQVHHLLTYLIVDHSEELENYIVLLDPFPEMPQFSNMKIVHKNLMYKHGPYSLEMELEHFNKSFHATGRSTADGIRHLRQQLRAKQKELFKMIVDLQEKNLFSEDIKNRQLHQLICTLVFLCTPGNVEKEIQLEAGCCLGEIGPVDLSTIILHSSNREIEITSVSKTTSSCLYQEYNHILKLLSDYLKDPRIHIKTVATDVLKNVFKTKTAQELIISCKDASWLEYLYPFYCNVEADDFMDEAEDIFMEQINQASLWIPKEGDHSTWLCDLVSAVLESGSTGDMLFQQLIPICKEEPTFCSQILPYLIRSVVFRDDNILSSIISNHMSTFFSQLSEELAKQPTSLSSTPVTPSLSPVPFYACKASVQTMLSVVNYLRLQDNRSIPPNVCHNCWTGLDLNYLLVAQAAQYCSAHFSAILYAELWWNSVREKNILRPEGDVYNFDSSQELHSACSPMSVLNAQNDDGVPLMHKIVLEAYSSIGDPDGIHGCIEIATDMQSVLLSHYTVEKKWNSLLNLYDTGDYNPGILKTLKNCRLNHILKKYIESQTLSGREPSSQTIEYQYECAWKLNQWDESLPDSENPGFQESFYKSLDCLKNQNKAGFLKHLELSRFIEFENLSHTSLESLMCILPMLSHLQMLVMMEDYGNVNFNSSAVVDVSAKWAEQMKIPCADFEFLEPVSWLQCNLLKQHLIPTSSQDAVAKNYVKCLLQHCIRARQENYLEVASNAINTLKDSSLGSDHEMLVWRVEEAKILWAKNEPLIANHILASVLNSMEKIIEDCSSDKELIVEYARTLTLKGKWSGELCSENSTSIMQNYLQKAIDVLEKVYPSREDMHSSDAHLAVARYADNQYQSIINYKNSTAYQAKLELMAESRVHAQKLKSQASTITMDQKKTVVIFERQYSIDEQELKNLDMEQEKFLMKAVSGYLTCLRQTDIYDLWVFRLTALWFHNLNNKNINEIIHAKVAGMEKYKFLPLMYQLAARMGSYGNKWFSEVLGQLIKDIALDHPHHALPIILSMSNADKDPSETRTPLKKGAVAEDTVGKERIAAAKILVEELQKTKHRNLIKNLSELCDAYITLAYMPVNGKPKTGIIPRNMKILKLSRMDDVPVITEVVKVDRSCQYQNIVGIQSFDNELRFCGGINVPKVIKCLGVDGVKREQLVKSRDDLRQDAVMQQVFSLVNCLLKENNETKRRKLSIRTYKVIPLSRRSGVLQWCEGTQVLSQYLIGPNPAGGAHKKYYPNFWTYMDCQKQMRDSAVKTLEEKRKTFDKICQNFPPVFRYFFLENFPDPSAWFERKQCYTKSVAASSIVGYILGLGDRHVNNILVDKRTAEVVHIDFGIAFEKGKILATPETVPFRLTRDIVDGMGFIGLEGVFKRCSEKTMEVMRNSHDILLTILEVLLHDPLYEWHVPVTNSSAAPMKSGNSGSSNSIPEQEVNKLAERALMRLKQKLQGLEKGVTLSVSGQVNMLIQQARDPNNLCRLFAGWQPYL